MKPFVHLHTHSHYSLLDGLGKIDELLDRAQELGMTAMALTDHANIYGAVEWCIMAKARGIKPIIGCEMYICHDMYSHGNSSDDKLRYHLVLLVENETGYKNLLKLITLSNLEGFHIKPRIDNKLLKKHHEGLIALSGCQKGEIPSALASGDTKKALSIAKEYQKIFGKDNFFLELQDHPDQQKINEGLLEISKKTEIPVVATEDIHYIHSQDAPIQDILLCIQTNRKVYEKDRKNFANQNLSLRTQEEMAQAFSKIPEALENTIKIADRCNFQIKLGETDLPTYPIPEGETADSFLRKLTLEGLRRHFKEDEIKKEHLDRMEYELDIIQKTGYSAYFLIVQDFINWAKNEGIIVGPGRGSAAGSFVSYLTGITDIDPIKYNLLFERFLNPERVSMPDVDVDFADDRRDDVLDYCREKYGKDHVAHIITFGTMAAKAAIRDAGRALGLPYDFCDKTAKYIPMFSDIEKALQDAPDFKRLYDTNPEARKLIDSARRLEGVCRHASVHACGIVITPKPVSEYTPLQQVSGHEEYVTQYSSSTKTSYVEKIGLLKMDFLGLKNLTIIQNTLKIIKKIHAVDIQMATLPLDDPKTYKLLQEGKTTGVFQLESSGMKRYLKLLKPTVFEDIIAMVALYRPGPMEWIPDFIDGKHGKKIIQYIHPKLEPILKDTYGVAVYQEQVMRIARDLAGFSMGEADVLRKAMGKKIIELIQEQKEKFAKRCVENGISEEIARKVFAFIEPFAGYGFNRSHAACYGLIGYQTAYLKAHYPAEFMAALMTSDQDNSDRIAIEAAECRGMGIHVLPPDINESFEEFAVILHEKKEEDKNLSQNANKNLPKKDFQFQIPVERKYIIRFGLNAIKNVGKPVSKEIVAERKRNGRFVSLTNFVERVHTKDLNKKSIEALAKVGALEMICERNTILGNIENILAFSKSKSKEKESNQSSLFSGSSFTPPSIRLRKIEDSTRFQKLRWERELLGLYVSDHPTSEYKEYLDMMCPPIHGLNLSDNDKSVRIGGVIQAVKEIHLKDKKTMAFVTLENTTGSIEALVFPKTYKKTKETWTSGSLVIIDGKISTKDGECKLITNSVAPLQRDALEMINRIKATRAMYHQDTQKEPASISSQQTTHQKITSENEVLPSFIEEKDNVLIIFIPENTSKKTLEELSLYLQTCPKGEMLIFLKLKNKTIKTSFSLSFDDTHKKNIQNILSQ
ncbi:MAG: DNA polymerase III subunit alpha [Candidatus Moraniibacteriota bacterium]|nr:MAG: DNA polymerase III subunit alpha [Candidatus Moranbacteria bacterium]